MTIILEAFFVFDECPAVHCRPSLFADVPDVTLCGFLLNT